MAHVMNVGPLDDPYIGSIEWGGYVWTNNDVFRDPVSIGYFLSNDTSVWTSIEANAVAAALQSWSNVANITFFQASSAETADLIEHSVPGSVLDGDYGEHGTPEDAFQTSNQYDGSILLGGNTYAHGYFNYESFGWDYSDPNGGLNVGGNGYWTLIHELGHGLGLAHPHDDGGGSTLFPGVTGTWVTGDNGLNQGIWTVMSYIATDGPASANTNHTGTDLWSDSSGNDVGNYGYFAGPMAFDIAAIQDLYGANTTYHNGSDTYWLPDQNALGTYWTCIWDTGGNDSIRYGGTRNVTINLTAATLDNSPTGGGVISSASGIHGGYTIANGVVIENAYGGSGIDTLTGNFADNILDGGAGADTMTGGGGNDRYYVDNVGDVVIENGGGIDSVYTTLTYYALGANVENLNDVGNFSTDFTGIGNSLNNLIQSYHGDDYLDGGAGADTLQGYNGDDTYVIDNAGDVVLESLNMGTDQVNCTLTSYTLAANVENLNYLGPSTTGFFGTGNALNNTIWGWNGSDFLDGAAGADNLYGYAGDDFYYVDNVGDVVVESVNQGNDWVECYLASYTLGANLENLNYIGPSTVGFNGTGNALNNTIIGWNGADRLDGSIGADTMRGLDGDDLFYVDNAGDAVIENANQGTDTVATTLTSYTLGANVENLAYNGLSSFTGIGNGLDNAITGSAAGDVLMGAGGNDVLQGGLGADNMTGGTGNDSYFVENAADAVNEVVGEGLDTVYASLNYMLAPNVETLVLQGGADLQGYGNTLANTLIGNSGNNLLDGGIGADGMQGGAGNDTYFVDNAGDAVVEGALAGNDTVFASVNFTLSANVETLILQGGGDLQGFGNGQINTLYGNGGNNLLNGAGGADLMIGGAGDDIYFVDNIADSVSEAPGAGNDTVFSTANFALTADVETLVLQGIADLQGYGNALGNTIYGNSGNNLINGGGGIDLMVGGGGNDSYFVDNIADSCFESAGAGNDTVYANVNYGLSADIETLVLQGSADLQGYGNNTGNSIYGNSGNNLLNGGGGADTMAGGAGNDIYFVDNIGDGIVESANAGTDTVLAGVSCALSANVEALVLQGAGNIDGIGNALGNSIFGNSGANTLDGGASVDQLTGNLGNDTFVFHMGQANGDCIVDFAGNGAAAGDQLSFLGYGAGATFTNVDATHWQVNYAGGAAHEVITFMNGAAIDATDVLFG
jgi:trimeric autotransporter adhesin